MKFTRILLTKNTRKFDEIISSARLSLNEAPQFFNELTVKKKEEVYDKLVKLNRWYMRVIGLDEVKHAQDKVMSIQEELNKTREKRREVETKLNDVNISRSEIHNEMGKIDKNIDFHKFIELRNQETEILKMVQPLGKLFEQYDQIEKEIFASLTNAIRDAHEKERLQMEYAKYIGLVLSLGGSFLAFAFASLRKEDLKRYIDRTVTANKVNLTEIENALSESQKSLSDVKNLLQREKEVKREPAIISPIKNKEESRTGVQTSGIQYLTNNLGYWPYVCFAAVALLLISNSR